MLEIAELQSRLEMYEDVFQLLYDGILVVDKQGYVTMISDMYARFLGIEDLKSVIGKHCTQVVENTRMHAVLQTGRRIKKPLAIAEFLLQNKRMI